MGTALARRSLIALWDCASWCTAVALVVGTRYEFYLSPEIWHLVLLYTALACITQVTVGTLLKLYRGKYRVGTFEEIIGLLVSTTVVSIILAVTILVALRLEAFPRAVAFLTPALSLLTMAGGRWLYRAWATSVRPRPEGAERVLVYGAGDAGYQLLRLMQVDAAGLYQAVGLIDDDPGKRHLKLLGTRVLGGRSELVRVARKEGATTVILTISRASATMIREVADLVERAGMRFLLLPPVSEMLGGRIKLSDVKEVEISDVLGRRQVHTDIASIAGYLTNKRVMVTGAGGSIGSEIARQVHRFGPSDLLLLDRDESALHGVQLSIYGKALLDTPDLVLGCIRDAGAMRRAFETHRPQVVFHAAALKHLPMLEQYPAEAWKTNVLGTHTLLQLSSEFGVEKFVNISTDKAADPTSVLGKTKRLAEKLTSWYGKDATGTYLSVRFGNVLGSRGSMLHTFQEQIRQGGPITVTHPAITRFFMTIPEASELVIQAGAIGRDGEVLVLDMGEQISILEVARRLISRSRQEIDIVFTGLRPNEKMHEVLFADDEVGIRRYHPLVTHVPVPPLPPTELESFVIDFGCAAQSDGSLGKGNLGLFVEEG